MLNPFYSTFQFIAQRLYVPFQRLTWIFPEIQHAPLVTAQATEVQGKGTLLTSNEWAIAELPFHSFVYARTTVACYLKKQGIFTENIYFFNSQTNKRHKWTKTTKVICITGNYNVP